MPRKRLKGCKGKIKDVARSVQNGLHLYIWEIYNNGLLTNRYVYDKLNRMKREDNKAMNKTSVYSYDIGGNILSRTEYAFTLGSLAEKTPLSEKTYSYKANGWRDQMTAYNGEKCVYDAMGRPTTYRNKALVWSRYGALTSYNGNTYTYDANGIRLTKTVNGVTTKFFITGTKLLGMEIGSNKLRFRYGVNGIQGFSYSGQEYIYRKNVQGDITHIFKLTNGQIELAAKYVYDAWGKCEVTEVDNSGIGEINPIRYRGYYYDTETKLYYLNARYYDPEVGRFISADSTQFLEPNTVNGLNLYAYCGNNPVMNVDPSGQSFLVALLCGFLIGAAIGGAVEISNQVSNHGWNASQWDWAQIGWSTLGGGVAGFISAIPLGGAIGAFVFGGAGAVIGGWINGSVNLKSFESVTSAFMIGAVTNLIGYGVAKGIENVRVDKIMSMSPKAKSAEIWKLKGVDPHTLSKTVRYSLKKMARSEVAEIVKNASIWLRCGIQSSFVSSILSTIGGNH